MRQRAIQRGLRLNEYGLFKSKEETRDPKLLVACKDEAEILRSWTCPISSRNPRGSWRIRGGGKSRLPKLLEWTDLKARCTITRRGATATVGLRKSRNTWKTLASRIGPSPITRRRHFRPTVSTPRACASNSRDQKVNEQLAGRGSDFRLLTGTEVDVLKDKLISTMTCWPSWMSLVASLHVPETTRRRTPALDSRGTKQVRPHARPPVCRLLLDREAYPVNQQAVIDACGETGTWIELNCNPRRFDLDWRLWPYAKSKGVKCVINPDAHRNEHAMYLRLGVGVARKGWLEKADVINTLPLSIERRWRERLSKLERQRVDHVRLFQPALRATPTRDAGTSHVRCGARPD